MKAAASVDDYIATFPPDIQEILQKIRATIAKAVPKASEKISYRMPAFALDGDLTYFAAFKGQPAVSAGSAHSVRADRSPRQGASEGARRARCYEEEKMKRCAPIWCLSVALPFASTAADLPVCEKELKLVHAPLPEAIHHMPEGTVLLEFTVDVQGQVSQPTVIESSNHRLNEWASVGVLRWQFSSPKQACRHRMHLSSKLKE